MPLGAARLTLLARSSVAVAAEVIRKKQSIQAFGNAQIDTAQYKFGGASADFDGTGDYVTASNTITLDGDFTIEGWYRADNLPGTGLVPLFTFSDGHLFYIGYSGGNTVYDFFKAGSKVTLVPVTISGATWYHTACVRSGSTISIYHNGTLNTTGTYSGTITATLDLAKYSTYYFDGHIDEVRISDTARYTSGFTPSTTPFVNDDDTLLLMHMDGSDASTHFEDDNGVGRSAVGVSAVATAQVDTAQSYFGGSSALFNPSSLDHLLIDDIGGSNNLDTNWTFECWYRPTNRTGTVYPVILANHTTSWASGDWGFFDRHNSASTKFTFFINAYSSGSPALESTTVVSNGTWYHLAVVKQGNDYELFVNGTSEDTLTTAAAIATNRDLRIGSSGNAITKTVNGHIDEVRISDTARYTTGFTAPTAPFVNDSNTKLLLHMDGTDASTLFLDDNGASVPASRGIADSQITAINEAQIDTAINKFGSSSLLLDGTNDRLEVTGNYSQTGDFTAECWIYPTSTSGTRLAFAIGNESSDRQSVYFTGSNLQTDEYGVGGVDILASGGGITINNWHHIALVREGSTVSLYQNGSRLGTTTSGATIGNANNLYIGTLSDGAIDFVGNIDEFRLSRTARYSGTSYTTPTEAFTDDSDTLLLLHMEGADGSTVFKDGEDKRSRVGVTAVNQAQIDTAQYKFGGASALFDGASDYLVTGAPVIPSTGDFTIEFWVRMTDLDTAYFGGQFTGGSAGRFNIAYNNSTDKFQVFWNTGGDVTTTTSTGYSTNTWYHFAVSRDGDNLRLFIDGALEATTTGISGATMHQDEFWIGGLNGQSFWTSGNIDEFRISNTARYTAAFTPETTPFQNDANTLLLLHMDGTDGDTDFVDDNGKESA